MDDIQPVPPPEMHTHEHPPVPEPKKKGFWSKLADALGEMLGAALENRQ